MDTIDRILTTADLPADMQAPGAKPDPRVRTTAPVLIVAPHVGCDHGPHACDECLGLMFPTR